MLSISMRQLNNKTLAFSKYYKFIIYFWLFKSFTSTNTMNKRAYLRPSLKVGVAVAVLCWMVEAQLLYFAEQRRRSCSTLLNNGGAVALLCWTAEAQLLYLAEQRRRSFSTLLNSGWAFFLYNFRVSKKSPQLVKYSLTIVMSL